MVQNLIRHLTYLTGPKKVDLLIMKPNGQQYVPKDFNKMLAKWSLEEIMDDSFSFIASHA